MDLLTRTLSPRQRRLWIAEVREGPSARYVLDSSLRLRGALDVAAMGRAVAALLEVHRGLADRFAERAGEVVVESSGDAPRLRVVPVAATADLDAALVDRAAQVLAEPMDVRTGPLVTAALVTDGACEHVLVLAYHHLLGDGTSSQVLREDLMRLYGREVGQDEGPEPAPAPTGEPSRPDADAVARALVRLDGAPPRSTVPPDHGADPTAADAHWVPVPLDADLTSRVAACARERRVTPFILYSAALHLLVRRYSGQTDTVVGFMSANRSPAERRVVALRAQTLVQRLDLPRGADVAAVVAATKSAVRAASADADVEIEQIVAALGLSGGPGGHPLFQAMVNVVELGASRTIGALHAEPVVLPAPISWLDLEVRLHPRPDGTVEGYLRCPRRRYTEARARALATHLVRILEGLLGPGGERADGIGGLDTDERTAVVAAGTGPSIPIDGDLPTLLRASARRHAVLPAVGDGERTFDHATLLARAEAVAGHLVSQGVGPDDVVGVAAVRSVDLVVAVAGVVLAGAAFAPIDPSQPAARRRQLAEQVGACALLVDVAPSSAAIPPGTPVAVIATVAQGPPGDLPVRPGPGAAAYVLTTSGSTGAPKAVCNTQAGIVSRLAWMQELMPIGPGSVVVQKTPITFDVSVWELLWPLLTGARMALAPPEAHRDPARIGRLLREEGATVVHFVPSMLRAFIDAGQGPALAGVEHVVCSGEALPADLARATLAAAPVRLHNLYGPTEAAIDVTAVELVASDLRDGRPVPIGAAVANTHLLVLDAKGAVVPFGAVGELHIGGAQVARGYLNDAAQTAERFLPDPLAPGGRLYRTGDLARLEEDGSVHFLGRVDRQVKVNGMRVEPGEVESALAAHRGVRAVHVAHRPDGPRRGIVAFYTADGAVSPESLTVTAARRLPAAMVPARCVPVGAMPVGRSGKVDEAALLALDDAGAPERSVVAPAGDVEEALLAAVVAVVGREDVGVTDSFFAIGGDSVRSLELVARARSLGLALDVHDVFTNPTVREMANVVGSLWGPGDGDGDGDREPEIGPLALLDLATVAALPDGLADALPPSAALAGLYVESRRPGRYRTYTTQLHLDGPFDRDVLERSLRSTVARHPMLRSALVQVPAVVGDLVHVVHERVPVGIEVVDLRDRPDEVAAGVVAEWAEQEARRPFDWSAPPLLRLTVHRLADERWTLTLAEPYLDGYSAALVLADLLEPAPERTSGVVGAIALRQHVAEQLAVGDASRRFWEEQMAGRPGGRVPWLDADDEDAVTTHFDVAFDGDVSVALEALNRSTGVPVKSMLLTAHLRVVAALTGELDVVAGLMANARPATEDGVGAVGLFLNVTPVRVRFERASWWEHVEAVRAVEAATLPHRAVPYVELVRSGVTGEISTLFNFTRFEPYARIGERGPVRVRRRVANDQTYVPLTAQFQQDPVTRAISLRVEVLGRRLDERTATMVAGLYRSAVTAIALTPDERADESPLDVGITTAWDRAAGLAEAPRSLVDALADTARARPDAVAARDADQEVTYDQLLARATRLAHALLAAGVEPGDVVGVHVVRSVDLVVALVGTLLAGAVSTPLDPEVPLARRRAQLERSPCRVLVGDALDGPGMPTVVPVHPGPTPPPHARRSIAAHDPAAVIPTSGSTGEAKGVVLSHAGLHARALWVAGVVGMGPTSIVAARTPMSFVDSLTEILTPLVVGATIAVVGPEGADPDGLIRALDDAGATHTTMVPSMLAEVLRARRHGPLAPTVRCWTSSGEPLPTAIAHELRRRAPGARIVNLYGSTEVTGDVTAHVVTGDEDGPTIPIGRPADGCAVAVVDPWGHPVPPGTPGELLVAGVAVAQGYVGDPEAAACRRRPGPPGLGTAFATGDLCRRDDDGTLVHLGRLDRQMKVRGVRIEPIEVERALADHPAVEAGVVLPCPPPGVGCEAHLVLVAGAEPPDPTELRSLVRASAPAAAVPVAFHLLEELPRTASGKVDARAVRAASTQLVGLRPVAEPPATAVEQELARIWSDRLGCAVPGRHSDFFALGGNSLHALLVAGALRDLVGVELSISDIFDRPTLCAQADLIAARLLDPAS